MNRAPDGRRMVLGIGNILNRDEGLGVHALESMTARLGDGSGIEVVDGGVRGLALLPMVEECSHLVVIDAIDAARPPGTVIELGRHEIPLFAGIKMSEHQVSFQEVLGLALMRGTLPEHLHLVGAQPADVSIGLGMTPAVDAVIPTIVARVLAVLARWELVDGGKVQPPVAYEPMGGR